MKAKDLIKVLEKHPEATVCFEVYLGGEEPLLSVKKPQVVSKGEKSPRGDAGDGEFLNSKRMAKKDLIVLIPRR